MIDDLTSESLRDHPCDEEKDLLPSGVRPAPTKHLTAELVLSQFPLCETSADVIGSEILQKRAVDKPIDLGTEAGKNEVAFPELAEHRFRDGFGPIGGQLVALTQISFELGKQVRAGNEIAGKPIGAVLHTPRH